MSKVLACGDGARALAALLATLSALPVPVIVTNDPPDDRNVSPTIGRPVIDLFPARPIRPTASSGYCKCGRRISTNKSSCLACA